MQRLPLITLALCTLALALQRLPGAAQAALYWDSSALAAGWHGGLITGHWLHVGADHLLWNVGALAILGGLLESNSRRLLLLSLGLGTLAVDLVLLVSPASPDRYCGLSGVLNTLMGAVLYLQWRQSRSVVPIIVALLWFAKTFIEATSGQGIVSNTTWPPFAGAHVAGMLATPLVFAIHGQVASAVDAQRRNKNHEHLVPGK